KSMTPEETILWQHLRKNQLDALQFRRQQIIDGYIVDFYCHQAGLVIEVDGEIHDNTYEYDIERSKDLHNRNLYVLRFQNFEVRNDLAAVLHQIRMICRERIA
ncbi:MAG TPA: endonuclease domain-containing protein, partial [Armatimonadota bacterium]